jgi:hypothetical protein
VSRPWSGLAVRSFALGLLALTLVGGLSLGAERQNQQRNTAAGTGQRTDADDVHQTKVDAAARKQQQAALDGAQAKADAAAQAAADKAKAADDAARKQQAASRSGDRPSTPTPPIPTSCSQFSGNQAIGCAILPEFGFGLDQMNCLVPLWNKESHWNERSRNASSGAYGIPQALPAGKMSVYGADYLTNPVPQIKWGLNYIKGRYRTPCGAWSFWQSHGWY